MAEQRTAGLFVRLVSTQCRLTFIPSVVINILFITSRPLRFHCFDAVGWAAGRASGL